jgi:hypothetical protein
LVISILLIEIGKVFEVHELNNCVPITGHTTEALPPFTLHHANNAPVPRYPLKY